MEDLDLRLDAEGQRARFAADVRAGLSRPGQKELPSKYLYDDLGSALFSAISLVPEYGLTRADERLLMDHAGTIVSRLARPVIVAELGSGNGRKTRWILESLARHGAVDYYPIDISVGALEQCERELGRLQSVRFVGLEGDYLTGLRQVALERGAREKLFVLFLGSTIGNFDRPAAEQFLAKVRDVLEPGDALLLGTDLVKPVERMLAAYDDGAGVTAAFNRNLLARINRELGGDFDLDRFAHEARYNESERRIEMHLCSLSDQTVRVREAELEVRFAAGESIWTESSYKFTPEEPVELAARVGFRCEAQWFDREWPFAENLWVAR